MKTLNVGLLGIGTVCGGTYNVLTRNAAEITRRTGVAINVLQVADKNIDHAKMVTSGDPQDRHIPKLHYAPPPTVPRAR